MLSKKLRKEVSFLAVCVIVSAITILLNPGVAHASNGAQVAMVLAGLGVAFAAVVAVIGGIINAIRGKS